ncbi:MAG TPA: pyridoxamine 5'-phosphate oxidase family protein [Blastocatellia bacterium]|jgi:hypothetical protein|nr:pyridoxamine 5'-phosphate oxidase family protein [Blastocatellia bacterium]
MERFERTERTTLKRLPARGEFDREAVYAILDEALVCHVGFVVDTQPFVIPTAFVRVGDRLFIHGSAASRMLRSVEQGIDVCVTVTLIDGLVLARSAFHHSINYRSVVIFAKATVIEDPAERLNAMRAFTDHIVPGRWNQVREPNEGELKATLVLSLPLTEASAKIRTGPPLDDEADYDLPVWAGVIPLAIAAGSPITDPGSKHDIPPPEYAINYSRTRRSTGPPIDTSRSDS